MNETNKFYYSQFALLFHFINDKNLITYVSDWKYSFIGHSQFYEVIWENVFMWKKKKEKESDNSSIGRNNWQWWKNISEKVDYIHCGDRRTSFFSTTPSILKLRKGILSRKIFQHFSLFLSFFFIFEHKILFRKNCI